VGRFLEHSRIFYFRNGGEEEIYLGSADLMPRNLNHRVEALFPVESPKLVQYLRDEVLGTYLADNTQAREMLGSGSYRRLASSGDEPRINSQAWLLKHRSEKATLTSFLRQHEVVHFAHAVTVSQPEILRSSRVPIPHDFSALECQFTNRRCVPSARPLDASA
jgi:hypothetical protein